MNRVRCVGCTAWAVSGDVRRRLATCPNHSTAIVVAMASREQRCGYQSVPPIPTPRVMPVAANTMTTSSAACTEPIAAN